MPDLSTHKPDFEQFLRVLWRKKRPNHLPFYEHFVSPGFIARRTGIPWNAMTPDNPDYWPIYVRFWLGMGYDCIPMEIPLDCPLESHQDRAGKVSVGSEAAVTIRTIDEFERYPWPDELSPIDFSHFERVAALLPDGVKIVGGVCGGPYEWASTMMGVQGLATAIYMDPQLVQCMFDKIGALHSSAVRQLSTMDAIGALRQGDDLGFKTSTFLSPTHLRQFVFPIYKRMVQAAHDQGKPFILHSCGNLAQVYDDLIDDVGIDAKHSFEDVILPVAEFKRQYRDRVTPLGGLDVDRICRSTPDQLRAYTRKMVEQCFDDGFWAFGTGNSLTDYMPVENYITALQQARTIT